MQGTSREDDVGVELAGVKRAVRTRQVEEGALARLVDEDDGRRCRHPSVAQDGAPVDTPLVEEAEEEVSEGVIADLAGDGGREPETGQPRRRVQGAAATMERYLVHEGDGSVGQLADRSCDHVGDEDAEADDVWPGPGRHAM